MTLLLFPNGENFAIGAIYYDYAPATPTETTNRIIIPVIVEGIKIQAVIDTGAPYPIISPKIARQENLARYIALQRITMMVREMRLEGSLIRLNLKLVADVGQDQDVDATAFIPDVEEYWGEFPSFIGQIGFLERICYAVNPSTDTFYFGMLG